MDEEVKVLIKRKRRNSAMWLMFTKEFSLQEIANIFKISKAQVHNVIKFEAKRRKADLEKYYL